MGHWDIRVKAICKVQGCISSGEVQGFRRGGVGGVYLEKGGGDIQ